MTIYNNNIYIYFYYCSYVREMCAQVLNGKDNHHLTKLKPCV